MKINENIKDWEDLPITIQDIEQMWDLDGIKWFRDVTRETTISELLTIWDIENDSCETAQVLRHLRNYFNALKDSK
jgi:hypothetical protein